MITNELDRRPARPRDDEDEHAALVALTHAVIARPDAALQCLADAAVRRVGGGSAGISVIEYEGDAPFVTWRATSGAIGAGLSSRLPPAETVCGSVISCDAVHLLRHPVRLYPAITTLPAPVVELLMVPCHDPSGRPMGTLWVMSHTAERLFDREDVRRLRALASFVDAAVRGERAHAEAAGISTADRRLSEHRRLALESARLGWWRLDAATGEVAFDPRGRGIAGLPDAGPPLTTGDVLARVHADDRDALRALVRQAAACDDARGHDIELRLPDADGAVRWVAVRGQAHFEGNGAQRRRAGFVGTVVDVTAVRVAQDALAASEREFRLLADSMPQIVWSAGPDGRVTYFNRRWYDYTGVAPDAVAADWAGVLPDDQAAAVQARWADCVRTGTPYEAELGIRRAGDGQYRWHLVRGVPLRDEQGRIVRWLGTSTDVHDSVVLKEQNAGLFKAEQAARAEAERQGRTKDEFLATLGHELRTPLNAILGWTHILRTDSHDAADRDAAIDVIERNARAQAQIIEDLLDMSRIVSGKVTLDVGPVELTDTLRDALEAVRPAADARGITLHTHFDAGTSRVAADGSRLRQAFVNLLGNAVKFGVQGGRVDLTLGRTDSRYAVRVSDDGEGIAPEFLPHVFDRFRQADATTTRRHSGLGLGLAIVRQLIELHGGAIAADSPGRGRGATFTVTLPMAAVLPPADTADPGRRAPSPEARAKLSGLKILIVDDEPDSRAMVRRVLETCDAVVTTAASAGEALWAVQRDRPDVLISDVGMPGEDGYSLINRLRAAETGAARLPAVALTAYAREQDRAKAIAAGFHRHVTKPVEAADLIHAVADLAGA